MGKKNTYHDYLRQELGGLIEQLDLPELYKQSLKRRWLDQVVWADKKAGECRQWHYRLRLTTIIGGVILPALVGINFQLGTDNVFFQTWFPYIPFTLSQIIAISAAVEEFCRFGDRWRDYRQMAEDLKAEGWQYLQLSGPYRSSGESSSSRRVREVVRVMEEERSPEGKQRDFNGKAPTHLKGYATFANRIEHIIKQDVQNYITELVQQQAKQEAEIEQYLESAKSVAEDKSLFASRTPPNGGNGFPTQPHQPTAMGANIAPTGQQYVAGYPNAAGYPNGMAMATPMAQPVQPPTGMMGTSVAPPPVAPPPTAAPPVTPPPMAAPPPVTPPPMAAPPPVAPPPTAATAPATGNLNLNSAILNATNSLRGMSSSEGPDGGNNACAWTLNKVLAAANIPELGENPNYVPSLLDALKQGRGQQVSKQDSKAGDLVVAYGEAHVGVALTDGGDRVLSNSSSRAAFVWESDADFDGAYGGPSVIYRLIQ